MDFKGEKTLRRVACPVKVARGGAILPTIALGVPGVSGFVHQRLSKPIDDIEKIKRKNRLRSRNLLKY